MKFWQKIKQTVPIHQVIFLVCIFLVVLVIFQFDSAEDIKVTFGEESVDIVSQRYKMNIPYEMIESVELAKMPDQGEVIEGTDNLVTRTGNWKNEAWGEYYICADLDCTEYIVAHLNDGRIFVFSRKNNAETQSIYEQLLTCLPAA